MMQLKKCIWGQRNHVKLLRSYFKASAVLRMQMLWLKSVLNKKNASEKKE